MERITVPAFRALKGKKKIVMLTAYDYPFGKIADEAGVDAILVGDTLGVVVQGEETTLPVTMDQMIYHTKIVSRAVARALVIGDMPFMSYQPSVEEGVRNAGRFLSAGGAAAVKLEGGARVLDRIEAIVRYDIPVVGHIGITPQSIHKYGGYKVQGRDEEGAQALIDDAKRLESVGVFSIVLEGMPAEVARRITEAVGVPTIGIGAGPHCDGQVLVLHDMLGLFTRFVPKYVRRYADLHDASLAAIRRFKEEVEKGEFPGEPESYR